MTEKTFWLSFADHGFKGVAIVDVDQDDADAALAIIQQKFPRAQVGAEWIAAATRKAHEMACNPGGRVMTIELPPESDAWQLLPRNILLSKADLKLAGIDIGSV